MILGLTSNVSSGGKCNGPVPCDPNLTLFITEDERQSLQAINLKHKAKLIKRSVN